MATDTSAITSWVEKYVQAWNSNDSADIGALFTDGAAYYAGPFETPWRGRDGIVREWLARKDEPGTTSFRYEVLATDGDTAIVRGWTKYHESGREYSNLWLVRFGPEGRCREFTEWWVERPKKTP